MQLNGVDVRAGKWLGLADGVPVAGGESFDDVAQAVLDRLLDEPRGLLTLLTGADAPALDGLLSEHRGGSSRARARGARGRPAALPTAAGGRVNGPAVRVVLVEDNETFRETLELLFGMREEIDVVASVATGDEAATVCSALVPDVVLMDYRMPGLNGAEATRAVADRVSDDARGRA